MKTVLFCTSTATPRGGIRTWLDQLCERLPQLGWRPVVGLARGRRFHDPERYHKKHHGLDVVVLDGRSGSREARIRAICQAARDVRADLLVPLGLTDTFEAAARLKEQGGCLRLLVAAHGASPRLLTDVARYGDLCDGAVAVSRLVYHLLIRGIGFAADRVWYVRCGVSPPRRTRVATDVNGPIRVGYVGRLDDDKRALDIIPFCERLDALEVDYSLAIVGHGVHDAAIRARLATAAGSGRVRFLGQLGPDDVYGSVYPELDCLLLFSESEGSPLAVIEGMAHGVVPVVSLYRGCLTERLVQPGITGHTFSVGDIDEAARLVRRLHDDPGHLSRLSTTAAETVKDAHSLDTSARGWAAAFDATVGRPPRAQPGSRPQPEPSGRLDALVSPPVGDVLRRLVGKTFVHPDASEWPFAGPRDQQLEKHLIEVSAAFEAAQGIDAGSE